MIRTLQIQDREISDANSYFVAKHGVITHSSGFWGNLTSITLKLIIDNIGIDYQGGCSHQNACQPKDLGRDRRPCGLTIYFCTISKFLAINSKKNLAVKIIKINFKIYEIYLKIVQIFSHQVCICPSFADTNIIREGMEVILQWRPPSFIILIILITNYKSGDFCVIWDNLGKRPT